MIKDYKEEIKKYLLHPEKADFHGMIYYPRGRVNIRQKRKKGSEKIGQKYIEYLHFINRGICSATYIAEKKGFSRGDSFFRLAQQKFNKPLAILRNYNIIEGLTGKESLKSNRNMTFYFFTPDGKGLYDEIIEKGFELPSEDKDWLDKWLKRVCNEKSERRLVYYFNQIEDYYDKVKSPFYRHPEYMKAISTLNTEYQWSDKIKWISRKQWLRNYQRALDNTDKTWLNIYLEKIISFVNVLIEKEEYDFLNNEIEPKITRLIKEYWKNDGIPKDWLDTIIGWFYQFLKLEEDGITRSIWRKILKNTIDNEDDKAYIKYCLFKKIDDNIFDPERQERIWEIIDSPGYRLIDEKKKTPSV